MARRFPTPGFDPAIAYFSMEVALESDMPTYSGGLGVLAGDTLRSAADLGLPLVGVTLVHRKGYFDQRFDASGWQTESPSEWSPEDRLQPVDARCQLWIEGRPVTVRAWKFPVRGVTGSVVPVLLLDTDVPENDPGDRHLTDYLYGGDDRYRLCQELILGVAGVRMLRALGYYRVGRFHMNEGHSALLSLELFEEELQRNHSDVPRAVDSVRSRCVFTTHTPVSAGHDQFHIGLVEHVLAPQQVETLRALEFANEYLGMTRLALGLSGYVNGVTKRHAALSRTMFPGFPIEAITNGVHSRTWAAESLRRLFDRYIPDWEEDNLALRHAFLIPLDELWEAHQREKQKLIDEVNRHTGAEFDVDVFTIGSARRATAYKRPMLLMTDTERLRRLATLWGGLQVVFSGKAHPRDGEGKELIRRIMQMEHELGPEVKVVYLPNYVMDVGKQLTAGVDLWLNTPRPPLEASGTSGMKAAHNGVPSLSVLDGWWLEGHVEAVTGWSIGTRDQGAIAQRGDAEDAEDLYRALEESILPLYYDEPQRWRELMRFVIALNASFFNTQRMVQEYVIEAYRECLLPYETRVPAAARPAAAAAPGANSTTLSHAAGPASAEAAGAGSTLGKGTEG
jgi:starch phosphorylase